jgi:crossover junction endodeoxyribonuclease RuvC
MIIIGVDPGTLITGYGIIQMQGSSCLPIDYGCIRPPKSLKLSDRYLILFNALEEILKKYQPEVLAVETQYVNKNVQSAIKLGVARGMAIITAKRLGIPVFEYAPSKTKLAVVGKGSASKQQVQGMVKLRLNLSKIPEPEDAADALALAICHAQSLNSFALCGTEM